MTQHQTSNISVTLVEPQGDWNIGAVARAMKNFGLDRLKLVNPVKFDTAKCYMAAVAARDLIDAAVVHPTLEEAVADDVFVVGFTRRSRHVYIPVFDLPEVAPRILDMAGKGRLTLMFGREDDGLTNAEINIADIIVSIPTSPLFASLNLSQAVLLACYELFKTGEPRESAEQPALVPKGAVEPVFKQWDKALISLDYDNKGDVKLRDKILDKFRRILGRSGAEESDVNMLMGLATRILEKTQKKL